MNTQTKTLKIGTIINQDLTIPVITFGTKGPLISIIGGTHGNEPESLFIMREIARALEAQKSLNCRVKFLLGVNAFGLINNTRVGSFDFKDLNRSFPGKADGELTDRIANAVFNEVKNSEIVVDIHSVTNWGSFMGMELNAPTKSLVKKTQDFNRLLNPPFVWRAIEDAKYANASDESLLKIGVLGIGVEVPKLSLIDDALMARIVESFMNVIKNPTLASVQKLSKPVPVLGNAKRFFSDLGGLFTPILEPMVQVKKGDVVGIMTDLKTLKDTKLKSKFDGVLFVQSTKKLVKTGDKIYVVTEKLGEFM